MSRALAQKLLMTSAFLAMSIAPAHAVDIAVDGNIGAVAPAQAAAGANGTSAANGTGGAPAVRYTGAGVDATADANITAQQGGAGGNDTDGDATGTSAGGVGGDGSSGVTFNGQTTPTLTINNGIAVTGGAGGQGGNVLANNGNGGAGGLGGAGVTNTTDGASVTINGTAAIAGGNGGAGGTGIGTGTNGAGGAGGDGVTSNATMDILFGGAGTIVGGNGAGAGAAGSGLVLQTTGKTINIIGTGGTISGGNSGSGNAVRIGTGSSGSTLNNAATLGGATHAGTAVYVDGNQTTIANTGTIQSTTGNGVQVTAGNALTNLNNTGTATLSAGAGNAVQVDGTITTINNTSSVGGIRATTGRAISIGAAGNVDTITNANGIITSANTSTTTGGTVVVGGNVNGLAISGGIINNTGGGNVLAITADQTGTISSSSTLTATPSTNAVRFENAAGTFANTGTIQGNITSSASNKVQTITSTSGSINGNITLDDGADVVNMNGGTITGTVDLGAGGDTYTYANSTSNAAQVGAIAFGSGANTMNINESYSTTGAISTTAGSSTNATLASGKTLTVNHATDFADGTYTNNGTTVLRAGQTLSADADVVGAGARYVFQVNNASSATGTGADTGLLNLSGGTAQSGITAATNMQVDADTSGIYRNGANIRVVHGGAVETTDFSGQAVLDDSYLYDFLAWNGNDANVTFTGADANDIILSVSRTAALNSASTVARSIDPALDAAGLTGDTTFDAIQNRIAAVTNDTQYAAIVDRLAPTQDNAAQNAAMDTGMQVAGMTSDRMQANRNVLASGSDEYGNRVWIQGFGSTAKQGSVKSVAGYDSDTYGGAIGMDGLVIDGNTSLGAAASYGSTEVDSRNANRTATDIDSYQATIYGDHNFGQGSFVEGVGIYSHNKIDQIRHDVGNTPGLNARASYDATVYGLRAGAGHVFGARAVSLTPKVFSEYVMYDPDTYTETGAGGANLTVNGETTNSLNLGAGLEAAGRLEFADGGLLQPSVNVGYKREVLDEGLEATSSFAAGGGAFQTEGLDTGNNTFIAGAGMDYYAAENIQLSLDYGFEGKQDFDAHTGKAKASYRF